MKESDAHDVKEVKVVHSVSKLTAMSMCVWYGVVYSVDWMFLVKWNTMKYTGHCIQQIGSISEEL